jgi:hypothetical protein
LTATAIDVPSSQSKIIELLQAIQQLPDVEIPPRKSENWVPLEHGHVWKGMPSWGRDLHGSFSCQYSILRMTPSTIDSNPLAYTSKPVGSSVLILSNSNRDILSSTSQNHTALDSGLHRVGFRNSFFGEAFRLAESSARRWYRFHIEQGFVGIVRALESAGSRDADIGAAAWWFIHAGRQIYGLVEEKEYVNRGVFD